MEILAHGGLIEYFFDILHCVGTAVSWDGAGLTDGVDVTHVSYWWDDLFLVVSDGVVDFLV